LRRTIEAAISACLLGELVINSRLRIAELLLLLQLRCSHGNRRGRHGNDVVIATDVVVVLVVDLAPSPIRQPTIWNGVIVVITVCQSQSTPCDAVCVTSRVITVSQTASDRPSKSTRPENTGQSRA